MTDILKQRIAEAMYKALHNRVPAANCDGAAQAVMDIVVPMLPKWMPIDDKIVVGKIHLPVRCQNGHEAIATYKFDKDRMEFIFQSVPKEEQCNCPKWDIGEGYSANGKPYTILASPAKG